ncbi:MAG: energy transducer TonB, partial [Paludibacter sp.]|nr:energy transducer TonB [Paludibacter sp.]
MKTLKNTFIAIFSATVFFGCINSATAQEHDEIKSEQNNIYNIVEQMPTFPGGADSLITFLYRNAKYPQFDHGCVEGRVIVRFVVDENGDIKDTEILRKLD